MPAEGTIFYSWASARERRAFELLVNVLEFALEDVGPAHYSTRHPIRFWIHEDDGGRIAELARYNGVADSTVYRLIFKTGLRAIERALGSSEQHRPVRMENGAEQW